MTHRPQKARRCYVCDDQIRGDYVASTADNLIYHVRCYLDQYATLGSPIYEFLITLWESSE